MNNLSFTFVCAAVALSVATPCEADDAIGPADVEITPTEPAAPSGTADLAKKLANPIASLISVPFQQNVDFGIGPTDDGVRSTLNIQPVVPISINDGTNLISRTVLPVIYQNGNVTGDDLFGLGDVVQSFFLSPKKPTASGIVWGAGPVLLVPTATDGQLGARKLGIGPTVVALKQNKGLTFGILANHIWSIAGSDSRDDLSNTFLQPFVSYTWPSTVGVSLSTETLYNWKSEQWIVPINLGVSKIVRLAKQPVSLQAGVRYYAERPTGGPDWGLRLGITLLFPKK